MTIDNSAEARQAPHALAGSNHQERQPSPFANVLIATLLVAAGIYLMRPVVLPLVLAIFFSALARPLQNRLQKLLPGGVALLLTIIVVALALVGLVSVFATNFQTVAQKAPEYLPRIRSLITEIEGLARSAGIDLGTTGLAGLVEGDALTNMMSSLATGTIDFLGQVALVIFMMVFVLSEANIFSEKLAIALKPTNHARVMESFASMQERIQQYVQTKSLFAALNAVAAGVLTWVLGIDFPVIWGLLTFVLYFIPTFGTLIATIPPVLIALVQFESPTTAVICLAGLIVIFNVLGNVVEPRFLGRTLSLSPLIVFVSLIFWGWFFGVVGFVLSVPLTVVLGIVCEHIPALRPIAVLIADKPRRITVDDSELGERAR